jgi:hypothetical protein
MRKGYSVRDWRVRPTLMKKPRHSYRHYFTWGAEMYKMGYEPVHVLERIRWDWKGILYSWGYVSAILKRIQKYEFAPWVFKAQTQRLVHRKKRD